MNLAPADLALLILAGIIALAVVANRVVDAVRQVKLAKYQAATKEEK